MYRCTDRDTARREDTMLSNTHIRTATSTSTSTATSIDTRRQYVQLGDAHRQVLRDTCKISKRTACGTQITEAVLSTFNPTLVQETKTCKPSRRRRRKGQVRLSWDEKHQDPCEVSHVETIEHKSRSALHEFNRISSKTSEGPLKTHHCCTQWHSWARQSLRLSENNYTCDHSTAGPRHWDKLMALWAWTWWGNLRRWGNLAHHSPCMQGRYRQGVGSYWMHLSWTCWTEKRKAHPKARGKGKQDSEQA